MDSREKLHLTDVIDIDLLQNVQDKLSKLVNVSVVTVDSEGNPVGDLNNFTPFCDLVRSSNVGAQQCIACDAQAEKKSFLENRSITYDCHLGLKDCCVPIIVDGELLGAVLGAQVLIKDPNSEEDPRKKFNVPELAAQLEVTESKLQEAIDQLAIVEESYLQDCVDLYELIANYLKEMGLKSIAQKQFVQEYQEKLAYEKRLKSAELKTIEAQINPHFLFNTLNTIARIAMKENAEDTEEMIYNLSDLLRYNLRQTEEFPTLESELANIKRYLYIQKTRYQDRLNYTIDVPDELLQCCIPNMIMQPIVENAIIHGIEPLLKGGQVAVSVTKEDDSIIVDVSDTGVGMSEFIKSTILDYSASKKHPGLGVNNSHLRLKDYFGEGYGLVLEKKEGFATTVKIIFPAFTDIRQLKTKERA
ncbi:PocR ligand-binding domain-containing protein [Enterococcus sp. 669A]|uniref:PocR ligand-binding domain-containing protein n=1 Tax=Candidatus Enterococcus moelleringii TaxID=2815325 RepID=A0ABS3L7S0_9ENTE|nr:PocR ligand-binding domain-containing protein [Enterococcus sp. 669A]MBO1305657.1 PocR ligand-binding domain-containing protein [Enterococcus sp. 669A]